jgi:hypothetical protein
VDVVAAFDPNWYVAVETKSVAELHVNVTDAVTALVPPVMLSDRLYSQSGHDPPAGVYVLVPVDVPPVSNEYSIGAMGAELKKRTGIKPYSLESRLAADGPPIALITCVGVTPDSSVIVDSVTSLNLPTSLSVPVMVASNSPDEP